MRILALFLFVNVLSFGQELTCFSENGKFGFKRGNTVVIQPQYEYADHFREGRAAVQLNKKWGFIDESGKMVIEPKYWKVEAFSGGYARFYDKLSAGHPGATFGLLDKNGNELVSAICTSTAMQRDCYVYHAGKNVGWIGTDGKTVVEPVYEDVDVYEYFIQAAKPDKSVDIYLKSGELIAAGAAKPSMILSAYVYSKYVDVQWTQETRILDQNGKQVGPTYSDIEKMECSVYSSTGDNGYTYYFQDLFKLNIPANTSGSVTGTFHLLLSAGHLYNKAAYVNFFEDGEKRTTVEQNGSTYELNSSGEFVPTKYKRIDKLFNNTIFTYTDGTAQIVEFANFYADTSIIGAFSAVRLLLSDSDPVYEEQDGGDYWNYELVSPFYQNIVEVEGMNENKGKFALFSLVSKTLVTPYRSASFEIAYCDDLNGFYIYKDETGNIGATLAGQTFSSTYSSFLQLESWGFLFMDSMDHQSFYSAFSKKMMDMSDDVNVLSSTQYYTSDPIKYDEETGESYYFYTDPAFSQSFVLLMTTGEHPKFGFIDGTGKMVKPQFDSISDGYKQELYNPDYPILYTYLDGKYGAYEYYTSRQVPPVYAKPLQFNSQDFPGTQVCPFIEEGYVLTIDNKKLYSDATEPFVFKQGKLVGLKDYSNFMDVDSAVTIIQPLYKEFKEDFDERGIVIAKGQNNKWGVLSTLGGDTLMPFEYTNIERTEEYYSMTEYGDGASWFKLFKGKKVGLYVPRFKRSLPAIYDRIELNESESAFGITLSVQVFAGDMTGLYSDELKELYPCEFDGIVVLESQERMVCIAQQGEKYYAVPYFEVLGYNWSYPRYEFDLVMENQGLRKTEKGYDSFSIGYGSFLGNTKDSLAFESEGLSMYQPFIEKGMMGIRNLETGEVVFPAERKMIEFLDDYYLFEFNKGQTYYRSPESPKKSYKFSEY